VILSFFAEAVPGGHRRVGENRADDVLPPRVAARTSKLFVLVHSM
jgi:hypothetical protein